MTRSVAEAAMEQRVINDIQTHGWHCVHIATEDELPRFSFSLAHMPSNRLPRP